MIILIAFFALVLASFYDVVYDGTPIEWLHSYILFWICLWLMKEKK